jgi:hypothetical protein
MNGTEEIVRKKYGIRNGKFYRLKVLQKILKDMGLNYSIYSIRDYESWKCLDYKCGHRHDRQVDYCQGYITKKDKDGNILEQKACRGPVRPPLIHSPRTRGGGKGKGHRRYTLADIVKIVDVFKERT